MACQVRIAEVASRLLVLRKCHTPALSSICWRKPQVQKPHHRMRHNVRRFFSTKDNLVTLSASELAAEAAEMDAEMLALFGSGPQSSSSGASKQGVDSKLSRERRFVSKAPKAAHQGAQPREASSARDFSWESASSGQSVRGPTSPLENPNQEPSSDTYAPQPIINITYNIHHHHYHGERSPPKG
jgi:hypothetical protein